MNDQTSKPELQIEDWQSIAEKCQRLMSYFMSRQGDNAGQLEDMKRMGEVFMQAYRQLLTDPAKLAEAQVNLWQGYMDLWQATARRMAGGYAETIVEPDADDRRFRDDEWRDNAIFDYLKQSYLLSSNWVQDLMGGVEGLDDKTKKKLDFYTKLYVDALSPSNFAATNPEVLRATAETRGENLVKGLENLLDDFEHGKGQLSVRMVDENAFEVGETLATTPGKVVFQNDLIQLIQFTPVTEKVHKKPLLIVPPWINKYYVLDLRPQNSFIRWIVEQGHTVFVVSWVNPDVSLARKDFSAYLLEGPMAALDALQDATGEKKINILGYCIGGSLVACTLAYMAAKKDNRIASATFLTSLTDFEDVGEIDVFIDEEQVRNLECMMNERGYLEGFEMAATFNTLRANDLVWSFVINNYLMGKEPFPFDILYWNSDSTRMSAAMHSEYLRRMYLDNALAKGELELDGTRIDMTKVKAPVYMVSTREDHIAPWESTYKATQQFSGKTTFTLAASGHIAGIVNPPAKNKYGYWTNDENPASPDAWLEGSEHHDGSWWPTWADWLAGHAGAKVTARQPGEGKLKAIEDAPGNFAKLDLRKTS